VTISRLPALLLVPIVLLAASCTPQRVATPAIPTRTPAAGLANPASVFCEEQGFRLELLADATGGQSGICHFPDGSQGDEWAYFRGECGPAGAAGQATGFEYAGIVVPPVPGEELEAMLPRWRTCPQPYTVVGGIGYFQSDPLHPDRILFLSIGQYAILAVDDQPWQETIKLE
jgi:putative hemolysin